MWPIVVGAGMAAAGLGLWRIGAVSKGARIPAQRNGEALLLIDLQTGFLEKYADAEDTLARILARAEVAKAEGRPVIAIQQIWRTAMGTAIGIASGGAGLPASAGTTLDAEIARLADHILIKNLQDSFHTGALDDLLAELDVGSLEICGLDGIYCVRATVMAARNRGYEVQVNPELVLTTHPAKFRQMFNRWALGADTPADG